MLGDVDGRPAPFAAEGYPLQHAKRDEQDRRDHAHLPVTRQQAYGEGRRAHQADGDQEGRLASDPVADTPEDQRASGRVANPAANDNSAKM